MEETDVNEVADQTCLMCGRHLTSTNRSLAQPELCKDCAGEQDDAVMDDFK